MKIINNDKELDALFPDWARALSGRHWSPMHVAARAADFLAVQPGTKVLDIGSGVGKFCLTGAMFHPAVNFYGVEFRENLVTVANNCANTLELTNVYFEARDINTVDLKNYDHFYFYNSFYENIAVDERIDEKVAQSVSLYKHYQAYLLRQLEKLPSGTRLATFYGNDTYIPRHYHVVGTYMDELLKFWIKL